MIFTIFHYLCVMTIEEFEILLSPQARKAIEENIQRNPADIALDKHIEHPAIIATQVKRLQRAKSKLPSLYRVRAIMPPKAYEQSSSELCAERKRLSGESVLDLTCGLGVDTIALSSRFKRVVSCEKNSVLSKITQHNLSLLGIDNVEVKNCSAEEYLSSTTEHFDWVFADPDRRGERGEKLVKLTDCSPDIITLLPRIKEVSDALCIKCSPLFDTAEANHLFGDCSVETISLGPECKEVNIYINSKPATLAAEAIGLFRFEIPLSGATTAQPQNPTKEFSEYKYITIPDVSLVHSRLTLAAFSGVADIWSNTGVALSVTEPQKVLGRVFRIENIFDLGSKELKKELKGKRIEIFRRDCTISNADICKKFCVKEGAEQSWCFTKIDKKSVAIKMRKM